LVTEGEVLSHETDVVDINGPVASANFGDERKIAPNDAILLKH
jgi:hypothetical protein